MLDLGQGQLVDLIGAERGVSGFPEDVLFGPDGSMYWSSMFAGHVGRMMPDGTVTTQTIGPGVNSLVFSADGRLFVTEPWITDSLCSPRSRSSFPVQSCRPFQRMIFV